MLVKLDHLPQLFGVKIPKIFETATTQLSIPNAQSTAITHSFAAPRVACDVGMWWDVMLGAPQFFFPRLSDWPLYIYIIILCTYWSYIFGGIWSKQTYFILYIIYVQHIHAYQKIIGVSVSIQKPSHPLLSLPTRWAGLVHLRSKGRESEVPGIHGKTSVEGQPSWLKWKYISKKHNQFVNGALLGWNL